MPCWTACGSASSCAVAGTPSRAAARRSSATSSRSGSWGFRRAADVDFAFSEEQKALAASVRGFIEERFPIERVAEIADSDGGWDGAWWPEVSALGWTGVSVPEDAGGLGMGFLEEAIVLEETGRGLFPGPYFSPVVLAMPALASAPDLVSDVVAGKRAATLANGEDDGAVTGGRDGEGWALNGPATFVPDLAAAELVVVAGRGPDGTCLWAVER